MTDQEFATIKHQDIFRVDDKGGKLLTPSVKQFTDIKILRFLSDFQEWLTHYEPCAVLAIHCLYDPSSVHVPSSKHFVKKDKAGKIVRLAIAGDFHIAGIDFLSSIEVIKEFLKENNLLDSVGWGIYPDWNNPGHHIDMRGYRGRWGMIGPKMVEFESALAYANKKFVRK
jgi:hypothetical protein